MRHEANHFNGAQIRWLITNRPKRKCQSAGVMENFRMNGIGIYFPF